MIHQDHQEPAMDDRGGSRRRRTEKDIDRIQVLALVIKSKIKEAVEYRAQSGIEQIWDEDEDHYEGSDSSIRSSSGYRSKPRAIDGSFEQSRKRGSAPRSIAFVEITRPYVDAASARVADILLPTDDRNFGIKPTPEPDLIKAVEDDTPITDMTGQPVMRQPMPMPTGQAVPGQAPQTEMPQQQVTVGDIAKHEMNIAKDKADRAQTVIEDWLVECRYHSELRHVIEDAARIGVGVLKGPYPVAKKSKAVMQGPDGSWQIALKEEVLPVSTRIDPRNLYPDPACGENIHNGTYITEFDELTARQLMNLKGADYIDEMIDVCLAEGPRSTLTGHTKLRQGEDLSERHRFETWYFYGSLSKDDLEAAGCECPEGNRQMPAIVTMVNDHVVKATISHLDTGEFPYDVMIWQNRQNHWAGIGVARQMRTCQRALNAAVRNMMDNAGLSAGPQIVVDRSKIEPADGVWELSPRKIWWAKQNEEVIDVTKAFYIANIPTLQAELMAIIQYFTKVAEDVTGLPMLIQGQLGKAPDTVGGMQMLSNNASSVLRRIAKVFDDRITEPHIGRYYEWLLLYGPDEAKGDFTIDAYGSSALVERDLQNQSLMQLVGAAPNPAYGLDPEKVMAEVLKSQKLDPKRLQLDDEKKQAMAQNQPGDPRIAVAQMNIQARAQEKQFDAQNEAQRFQAEQQATAALEQQRMQFESQEAQFDRALEQWEKNLDAQLKAAELAGDKAMAFDDLKAMLTREAMKLRTQKELSFAKGPQVATPPTEPAGRAPNGMAFAR